MTTDLLGCSLLELKKYIEKNFQKGMSWSNWSQEGWHLDHIRPCSSFKLEDKEKRFVCFNWRNLQPIWARENLSKGDNYTPLDEVAWVERMQALGYKGELFLKFEEGNSY